MGRHRAEKGKSTSENMTGKRNEAHDAKHDADQAKKDQAEKDRQAGIEATKALLRKRRTESS